MAAKELRDLRHAYKSAYTSYGHCVKALSDATEAGESPNQQIVEAGHEAFTELALSRHALLEALTVHCNKPSEP